jgi:hypothetical protein
MEREQLNLTLYSGVRLPWSARARIVSYVFIQSSGSQEIDRHLLRSATF